MSRTHEILMGEGGTSPQEPSINTQRIAWPKPPENANLAVADAAMVRLNIMGRLLLRGELTPGRNGWHTMTPPTLHDGWDGDRELHQKMKELCDIAWVLLIRDKEWSVRSRAHHDRIAVSQTAEIRRRAAEGRARREAQAAARATHHTTYGDDDRCIQRVGCTCQNCMTGR